MFDERFPSGTVLPGMIMTIDRLINILVTILLIDMMLAIG